MAARGKAPTAVCFAWLLALGAPAGAGARGDAAKVAGSRANGSRKEIRVKDQEQMLVTPAGLESLDVLSVDGDLEFCYSGFTDGTYGYAINGRSTPKVARFPLSGFNTVEILDVQSITGKQQHVGGFSDGTYGYLLPHYRYSKIVRFRLSDFSTASVQVLDTGFASGTHSNGLVGGFWGGFVAGTYGYAMPYVSGNVVRFSLSDFSTTEVLDASAADAGLISGSAEGFTDGTYGYMVPLRSTKAARFLLSSFDGVQVLDVGGVAGFIGGFADSSYGYLCPRAGQPAVRFLLSDFSAGSVQRLDVNAFDNDLLDDTFTGGFSDGTYGYLVPTPGGKVPKFRLSDFSMVEALDVSSVATGFYGGFEIGGYGYMMPWSGEHGYHGNVVRFQVEATSASSSTAAPTVSGTGDPHLTNVYGERFDLMRQGRFVLIEIPRGKPVEYALLFVQADVRRLGGQCADMYFQRLNITGAWADEAHAGDLTFDANTAHESRAEWTKFGPLELKVAKGRAEKGTPYLNFYIKHLGDAGYAIGGLLGEDDHTQVATPEDSCIKRISLKTRASSAPSSKQSSVAMAISA